LSVFLLAARVASDAWQTIAGTLLGVAAAFLLGWLFFTSTRILQVKTFFRVTNVLLTLFAAGMVGLAVGEFIEAGWLRVNPTPIWNLTPVLPDTSFLGGILKALFGYNPAPSLTAVLAYVLVALVLFWLVFRPQVLKKPAQVS
jgi:high-affinity iron transporter